MRDDVPDSTPDWMIERFAAGDLAPADEARLRARLAARGELDRVGRIAESNAAFLAAHPAASVAAEIRRRTPPRRSRFVLAVPALAAALLAIWLVRDPHVVREDVEVTRQKGQRPHLVIYKKTPQGPERLADRARVRPGDTIQVAYVAAAQRFGVIVSLDGRGAVTLHLPEEPGPARELAHRETALPRAFVLDDSPGYERFVFVTSDRVFSSEAAVAAARGTADPALVATELVLDKELP